MRFKSIEITNYRQYKNLQFQFPKTNEHDLHIIVGQNGMGKTNVLNAITWCLYGVEPHLGDESRSLPKINLEAKKEALRESKDIISIMVKIFAEDNGRDICIQRTLPINVGSDFEYKDEFIVTSSNDNNDTDTYEDNLAYEFVSRYMPEKIREYFYFDGEQLHNYFLTNQNAKVKDSVHTISQVDMLTRVSYRMGKIIIKNQKEAGSKAPDVQLINTEITKVRSQIDENMKSIDELENQINISERIIKDNTEHLRGQDNLPELETEFQEHKSNLEKLEDDKDALSKELKAFIRDYKIILSFYPHALNALLVIEEKESNNSLPPNIDKNLFKKMLDHHKCVLCEKDLSEDDEKKIQKTLDQIMVSSSTSHLLLNIKSELERIVNKGRNYPHQKEKIVQNMRINETALETVETKLQKVDNAINQFTDKEQIKMWHKERDDHEKLFKINNQKVGVEKNQLTNANEQLESLEKNLLSAISKREECSKLNEMITFSREAKQIVENVETDMMFEVKNKMEELTTNYFNRLVWKKNTYKNIELDDNYQLDLIHNDGYSCVGSCSAAERSLLALSFTLALHEVSGFNSLLFIDTPVARVSDLNRINFAEVLKEVSKNKQIIMTFTPAEYSEDVRKIFDTNVSTEVKLITEDEKYAVLG